MQLIQFPSHDHEHPLVRVRGSFEERNCQICSKLLRFADDYVFFCIICDYFFHYSCLYGPPFLHQINHPSHPDHPLTISEYGHGNSSQFLGHKYKCDLCGKSYDSTGIPYFKCARCFFYIDIFCALKIPTVIYENKNNDPHLCHSQPMRLVEIKHDDEEDQVHVQCTCYICKSPLSNPAYIYTCTICHHFFHRSCTDQLSFKIRNPFHLRNLYLILQFGGVGIKCHSCHKTCLNFVFRCSSTSQCHLDTCEECTLPALRPTIRYQGHCHYPLSLVEKKILHEKFRCNSPYSYCKQSVVSNEFTHTAERYIFYCQWCTFSLHFLCGPLPCVIKHNCHIHPLTLLDSMIEDDLGEYYCDACETQRDPRICVYYCAECKFFAHVNCVISEVVRVLQGYCRDDELRAAWQMSQKLKIESNKKEKEGAKQTILLDLFTLVGDRLVIDYWTQSFLSSDPSVLGIEEAQGQLEKSNLKAVFFIMNSLMRRNLNVSVQRTLISSEGRQPNGETSIQKLISSNYSDKKFEELVEKLNNFDYGTRWSKVTVDELKMEIVDGEGGYMIPWYLAHVLKGLLDKFGDVSGDDQSKSESKELTNILYFILCRLVYNMSRVIVADVTEDVLGDWYSCFKFLKSYGFKVDFVNSRLEQIVRAYFGLRARRAEIEIMAGRHDKVLKLRKEIEELEAKLERCKEDLETCERLLRSTETLGHTNSSETTILMKQCLDEASKLQWKHVADDWLVFI